MAVADIPDNVVVGSHYPDEADSPGEHRLAVVVVGRAAQDFDREAAVVAAVAVVVVAASHRQAFVQPKTLLGPRLVVGVRNVSNGAEDEVREPIGAERRLHSPVERAAVVVVGVPFADGVVDDNHPPDAVVAAVPVMGRAFVGRAVVVVAAAAADWRLAVAEAAVGPHDGPVGVVAVAGRHVVAPAAADVAADAAAAAHYRSGADEDPPLADDAAADWPHRPTACTGPGRHRVAVAVRRASSRRPAACWPKCAEASDW